MLTGAALLMVMVQSGSDAQQVQQYQRYQQAQRQTWLQRLELTEAQKARIEAISEQHGVAATEARAALIQARADLAKFKLAEEPDLRELERAMNALSRLENAQKIQAMRNRAEMLEVLTEEQRQQIGRSVAFLGLHLRTGRSGFTSRRGMMDRGLTRFDRGGKTGRGATRFGRGWSRNDGRAGMRGYTRSMRGYTRSMRPRGRAIPPLRGSDRPFSQNRMTQPGAQGAFDRGMMRGRGRVVVPPPSSPPPPTE